jgi:hypothetical protein
MKNIRMRAVQALVAAAFGAAFVGSALAATPGNGVPNPIGDSNGVPSAPSAPAAPKSDSVPGLNNGLTKIDAPKISGVAFVMDDKSHGGDKMCKDFSGKQKFPDHGNFQHPVQCKHNSMFEGKGDIGGFKF